MGELDYWSFDLCRGNGEVPRPWRRGLPLTGASSSAPRKRSRCSMPNRSVTMFRKIKGHMLGMVEKMSFLEVKAYLKERGGTRLRDAGREQRALRLARRRARYLFAGGGPPQGRAGGVPFLGGNPLNITSARAADGGENSRTPRTRRPPPAPISSVASSNRAQISIIKSRTPK